MGFIQGQIACFVAGARIATADSPIAVKAFRPGDIVLTLDHGSQPLRWVAHRAVASQGAFAALSIPVVTFGERCALRVSPQHPLLMSGWQAALCCGAVLVKVSHLFGPACCDTTIQGAP